MIRIIIAALISMLCGCALSPTPYAASGGLRPNLYTNPADYLRSFPLESVTEQEMLEKVGPPEQRIESFNGSPALVYSLERDSFGRCTYTYIFMGGRVFDVQYNDNGKYNGSTARGLQGK